MKDRAIDEAEFESIEWEQSSVDGYRAGADRHGTWIVERGGVVIRPAKRRAQAEKLLIRSGLER